MDSKETDQVQPGIRVVPEGIRTVIYENEEGITEERLALCRSHFVMELPNPVVPKG